MAKYRMEVEVIKHFTILSRLSGSLEDKLTAA
eukprot:CAMPEP_0184499806 /NCGR_PEP_ID=MMETSP0113_2-20130426/42561_1 /TAXON_ID=91329 /ORGANISM="Norrisiella sphaerica, Strain BC52" /LENGTH=31 /DNA_ID= /DNA_START= /DNA_END= /DNA_ORIENTATION=